ncbi:ATP-dependent zinc protease [Marispirochaeta aestuarii]|uniref:ATP-dependent zinc protease family protein n=1 Tax=Marispirochaeta aestuarii TaxID=1963862 RepID=UPI0029C9AC74|nr:ATP-dependent zinc protease [Marispirochaeta aestuarii]
MNEEKRAGWKEYVSLPELGLHRIVAKLDTGARSAALHASDILVYDSPGGPRVAFTVFPHRGLSGSGTRCTAPLVDRREVTNSGGAVQIRYIISTLLVLGSEAWTAEISLTDRTRMRYPMLLGRATLGDRFLVDPGRSYLMKRRKGKTQ